MAMAGLATGAKKPYDMTTGEIASAKAFLKQLKPNVLKLVSQNTEVVRALTDDTAWLTIENIGTDARVTDARRPDHPRPPTRRKGCTAGWTPRCC